SRDAAVMLDREDDLRRYRRIFRIARPPGLHEHGSAVAAAVIDYGGDSFIDPELRLPPGERHNAGGPSATTAAGPRLPRETAELAFGKPMPLGVEVRRDVPRRRHQHERAPQLSPERRKVAVVLNHGYQGIAGHRPIRPRRPCFWKADERVRARREGKGDKSPILP